MIASMAGGDILRRTCCIARQSVHMHTAPQHSAASYTWLADSGTTYARYHTYAYTANYDKNSSS